MQYDFWQTQSKKILFPQIEWNKPERRDQAGKLLIIGGSSGNFRAVANSFDVASKTGAGEVKVIVPDSLKKTIPLEATNIIFASSNTSGGFSKEAENDFLAASAWADFVLIIGDFDKNSESAILLENFVQKNQKPALITRDAVDILMNGMNDILQNENITIIASFAQMQKIFQTVFYPKVLTFSMQLANLAENMHKFSITYPANFGLVHAENFVLASDGNVISTPFSNKIAKTPLNPLRIWTGEIPTKIAIYQMWNLKTPLEAAASAIIL